MNAPAVCSSSARRWRTRSPLTPRRGAHGVIRAGHQGRPAWVAAISARSKSQRHGAPPAVGAAFEGRQRTPAVFALFQERRASLPARGAQCAAAHWCRLRVLSGHKTTCSARVHAGSCRHLLGRALTCAVTASNCASGADGAASTNRPPARSIWNSGPKRVRVNTIQQTLQPLQHILLGGAQRPNATAAKGSSTSGKPPLGGP